MRITALKYQVKNPDRVNVSLDGSYSFSLTAAQVLEAKLSVGKDLTDEDVLTLKEASFDGKLYMRALRWCFMRPRTEHEVRQYIRRSLIRNAVPKEKSGQKITTFVDELKTKNAFSDKVFVEWWLERRSSSKKSTRMLENELRSKGISAHLIKNLLHNDEASALRELIVKHSNKSKYAEQKKFINYLMNKGFSYSSIVEALAEGTKDGD